MITGRLLRTFSNNLIQWYNNILNAKNLPPPRPLAGLRTAPQETRPVECRVALEEATAGVVEGCALTDGKGVDDPTDDEGVDDIAKGSRVHKKLRA